MNDAFGVFDIFNAAYRIHLTSCSSVKGPLSIEMLIPVESLEQVLEQASL